MKTKRQVEVAVIESFEPIKVARWVLHTAFMTAEGVPAVWHGDGGWYLWHEGVRRWVGVTESLVFDRVSEAVEDLSMQRYEKNATLTVRFQPTTRKVGDIVRFLQGLVRYPFKDWPRWVDGEEGRPSAAGVVAFEDVLVDVEATVRNFQQTGKYVWVTIPRTPGYFGTVVLPFEFDPLAKAEFWEACMGEWLGDEESAWELRERFYGDCLRAERNHARALLEYGESRSGKGTGVKLLAWMLGVEGLYGTKMQDLSNEFGQGGALGKQVLFVAEVDHLDGSDGARVAQVLRIVLGRDGTTVNQKYREFREGVTFRCNPLLQGHVVPRLPDDRQGLSGKMLFLRFPNSFLGREMDETAFMERLMGEGNGIALRWLKALVRLDAEKDPARKWPEPRSATEVRERLRNEMRPGEAFIEACFVRSGGAFTDARKVRSLRSEWERRTGTLLRHRTTGERVSDQHLVAWLIENGGGGLARGRKSDVRGVEGIMPRRSVKVSED